MNIHRAAVAIVLVAQAALGARPVVFVHGALGAGEQYEHAAMLFASNGYPAGWIIAYDYNSVGPSGGPEMLDKFIDAVLSRTGAPKVDLVGHSRGTAESRAYLGDPARAAKVAHYANIAGRPSNNVGGVPTLVVGSAGDKIAGAPVAQEGAKAANIPTQDHVKVCTSTESFEQVYTFFNDGEKPRTLKIKPEKEILAGGYVKSYGQNNPLPGATVAVYEVAANTGERIAKKPLVTLTAAADGQWGPFRAKPGQHYEYVVTDKTIAHPRHYYREPLQRSDGLIYFRIASKAEGSTPGPLDKEPKYLTDRTVVFNVRQQNGALTPGQDSLKVNGIELVSEELTPARRTVVSLYLFDGNENGKTDGTPVPGLNWNGAFAGAVDMFIPAEPRGHVEFKFNGRTLNVPNWKGSEAGQIYVIFD
jgi:Lipase C-terminal domain/Lipase (class 2)/AF_1763-like, C-terminal domain